MTASLATATAITFVWLGMVLAISFLEAPLKFRTPGLELRVGLAIGRLVFKALNTVEAVLAVVLIVTMLIGDPGGSSLAAAAIAIVVLAVQILVVRPRLAKRSDAVLAGGEAPRSSAHHTFVALEIAKVVALLAGGVLLLQA